MEVKLPSFDLFHNIPKMTRFSLLFTLWTAQALTAFVWLAFFPLGTERGFSAPRLILLGITLALVAGSATLAWVSRRRNLSLPPAQQDTLYLGSVIAILLTPTTILTLFRLGETSGFLYTTAANRLTPLACWLTLSALELVGLLIWQRRTEIAASLHPAKKIVIFAGCFLLIAGIFAILGRLLPPTTKDGSWGNPTTPLLEWQILLALLVSLLTLLSPHIFERIKIGENLRNLWTKFDLLPALIYLLTCIIWLSQPIIPGYFATPPRAPNFEIYPFSDALIYAQYAQSALAGHGFLWPDVPARPFYIAFITWLHAIAGQDYVRVIALQTLVLAAFPVILYRIGKELGGAALGLALAILAILRDLTANVAAPFALNYTYSKLFFSEIPSALLISLFTLLSIRWMRQRHSFKPYAFIIGGILGLSTLVRLQSAVLLIAVIPLAFFVIKNRREWALSAVLMTLGVALTFAPWLMRNFAATGGLVLDNPISQTMTLARRWSGDNGNDLIAQLPGEGTAQYSSRMGALAMESLRQRPDKILSAAANHFINSQTSNLLLFPSRDQINSPAELIWPEHAFWQANPSAPLTGFYLILFALGLAVAWHKNGLPGLLPFIITLVYNAWTALFLSSGDRFLVPVDWAVYLYLFLGLLALVSFLLSAIGKVREHVTAWIFVRYNGEKAQGELGPISWRDYALIGAFILIIGLSLPLTEFAFPKTDSLNALAFTGKAIYPRYYKANQGEPGSGKMGYGKSEVARLVFFLVGEKSQLVIFPLEKAPKFFPNTARVLIIGTEKEGFIQAERITVEIDGKSMEYP